MPVTTSLTTETDVIHGTTSLVFSYRVPVEETPSGGSDEILARWLLDQHPSLAGLLIDTRSPTVAIANLRQALALAALCGDYTGHPQLVHLERLRADGRLWSTILSLVRARLNRPLDADLPTSAP